MTSSPSSNRAFPKERVDIFKTYGVPQYWFSDISERVREKVEAGTLDISELEEDVQKYADANGYFYTDQCRRQENRSRLSLNICDRHKIHHGRKGSNGCRT